MDDEQPRPDLPKLQIIAMTLLISVLIYAIVPFFVSIEPEGELPAAISLGMPIGAALAAVAAFVVRNMLLGTLALAFGAEATPKMGAGSPEETHDAALRRYQTGTIVSLAITEAVSLFGLVLAFLSGEPTRGVPFALVAMLLMAAQFPTRVGLSQVLAAGPRRG